MELTPKQREKLLATGWVPLDDEYGTWVKTNGGPLGDKRYEFWTRSKAAEVGDDLSS